MTETKIILLELCEKLNSSSTNNLIHVPRIDDVEGDQSGALINYYEIYSIDKITGNRILLATVDTQYNDYTVLGVSRNEAEAQTTIKRQLVTSTWSPSLTTRSFSIQVVSVGNQLTPPTFTGGDGITTTLRAGDTFTSGDLIGKTTSFDSNSIVITSNDVSDVIYVIYSELKY